jgi:predicted lipid-binding transport protein (Tim44 family)
MSFLRLSGLTLAAAASLAFMVSVADARVGGGSNSGSRGNRTYTAPPSTNTAPKQAAPLERTTTQPGIGTTGAKQPASPMASRFGGGFGGLLMGGLLGAGLFGLLSGSGLFGGLTGLASFIGLLLQVALIAGVVFLIVNYFRNRNQPAVAAAGNRPNSGSLRETLNTYRQGLNGGNGSAAPSSAPAIEQADYDAFEKLLGEIQTAYAREDTAALARMTTPEMLTYFSEDLEDARRDNERFEVSNVKLLQGDLAEAWQEPGTDYATVAMRFSMIDVTLDRASGRVISGSKTVPEEVTELWTFRRDQRSFGEGWKLSAIQQG